MKKIENEREFIKEMCKFTEGKEYGKKFLRTVLGYYAYEQDYDDRNFSEDVNPDALKMLLGSNLTDNQMAALLEHIFNVNYNEEILKFLISCEELEGVETGSI